MNTSTNSSSTSVVASDASTRTNTARRQHDRNLLNSLLPDPDATIGEGSDGSVWEPISGESSGDSSAEDVEDALEDALQDHSDVESVEDFSVEGRIVWADDQLREQATSLIQQDHCTEKCLQGTAADLENFLCSLGQMTTHEKKQSILTSLAMLIKTDTAVRRRGSGERQVFSFY